MDWRSLLILIFKGVLKYLADEYDPAGRRPPKEAPQPPQPPPADESFTGGWGPPSEPPPVTVIRVETAAGTAVAAASFIGDECFGVTKVERERRPGESRRARRKAPAAADEAAWVTAPRHPRMVEFAERMRKPANTEHAPHQEEARQATDAERAAALSRLPGSARRVRWGGQPFTASQLTLDTHVLLAIGERLTLASQA